MTPDEIAARVAGSSLDVPGGVLRGDVERQVRAVGLALTAEEVGAISLRNASDGRQLSVSDVARVTDTFDASQPEGWVGDDRAIRLTVMRTKNGDAIEITETARTYLAEAIKSFPPTLKVPDPWMLMLLLPVIVKPPVIVSPVFNTLSEEAPVILAVIVPAEKSPLVSLITADLSDAVETTLELSLIHI